MRTRRHRNRSGNVAILAAVMMIVVFALAVFAVDLGYLYVVRTEEQRAADAAAMAAAWELWEKEGPPQTGNPLDDVAPARAVAAQYAGLNSVAALPLELAAEDVEIGYLQSDGQIGAATTSRIATRVHIRRTPDQNGEIVLFLGGLLGRATSSVQAQATAVYGNDFSGFKTPSNGENLDILPFAIDKETWDLLLQGNGTDDWTWDSDEEQVSAGPDGILETNLYPGKNAGAPGNRGTVDVGNPNNSTADLKRQILYGVTPEDLSWHDGELKLDENGELLLNGDTGISAAVKDQLEQIIGQPRIVPIFTQLQGNGNNAYYTIVQFAGVRIMEVKLTGNKKQVVVQPAKISTLGGIPAEPGTETSFYILSPVHLYR